MPRIMRSLTIATRGSRLALWQANFVATQIRGLSPAPLAVSLLVVKTEGDKNLDLPLAQIGGKGLFVTEIENALLQGKADIAVHSMKDMPIDQPEELTLGIMLERGKHRDMFLSHNYANIKALPRKAKIGTGSSRRAAQLLALRPDLRILPLRGNVDTRLKKLAAREYDALILAAAGVRRLRLTAPFMMELPMTRMLPACGQGALGLEFRKAREDLANFLAPLSHAQTNLCIMAERGYLAALGGDCKTPVAAYADIRANTLVLRALLASVDGEKIFRARGKLHLPCGIQDASNLGADIAEKISLSGGAALLAELAARGPLHIT
ncbi:porphobilinogen deaminase [Deltaproteobacteria bacterium]|nr:porphobilinogen deaminase [Deltaproteobacteria bacterium]